MNTSHPLICNTVASTPDRAGAAQPDRNDVFAQWYRDHAARVTDFFDSRIRDHDTVEDLVHDTFLTAYTDERGPGHDVAGWLLRLAARTYGQHRDAQRQQAQASRDRHHDLLLDATAPAPARFRAAIPS